MADTNSLFASFNEAIKLASAKETSLRTSRDSLRNAIRKWMQDNKKGDLSFCGQGSFMIKTTVNPMGNNDYDIDDGVYLSDYMNSIKDDWPATSTVHSWIASAVNDKTQAAITNKNTCIRVNYAHGYHIDLPIYIINGDVAYLAHLSEGWMHSDPKEFTSWFKGMVQNNDEQLRRNVRYLKAWRDHKDVQLKSIELTILAAKQHDSSINRDDKSLYFTVKNIINSLEQSFTCEKPVAPYEDLFSNVSTTKKTSILGALKTLMANLSDAITDDDLESASEYLIEVFGDRFPKGKPSPHTVFVATSAPGVLKNDGRSG